MSIEQKIKQLREEQKKPSVVLSADVKETLEKSSLGLLLTELAGSYPLTLEERVVETGEKQLIIITWPTESRGLVNQVLISVRKDAIGFIGNHSSQYTRLTGEEILDRELLETCLAQTFVNPAKVSSLSSKCPNSL